MALTKEEEASLAELEAEVAAAVPPLTGKVRVDRFTGAPVGMRDDGTLFGYFETPDSFQSALDGMANEEINAKWQEFMAPYFEGIGGHADENMLELKEVFHLD